MKRHRVYWGLILMFLIQLGLIHFRSSAQGFNRWTYADPESILTTNFKVHFTLAGPDATTQQWADSVAVFAEQIRFIFTESMGWPTPPNDNGQGGDNRYDIYIFDVLGQRGAKGIVYQEANANPPGSYHFPS